MRDEKIGINCQLRNKLFLIVIHHFSLVKAAMNAPRLCKVCKDCLAGSCNGAMEFTKRLNFFIFQLPKVEQRQLRTCQLVAYLAIKHKGSQRTGAGKIC
jgi:hypothetical protein